METVSIDPGKRYTFADYLGWADGKRRELLEGLAYLMTPAPKRAHQGVSGNLMREIGVFLKGKTCKAYHAPFDVRLPKNGAAANDQIYTVVQPDICAVCDPAKLDDLGCLGAPDWIVEIVSKSSAKMDVGPKYKIYEEAGVREYWLIYPNEGSVMVFVLESGKYCLAGIYAGDARIKTHVFPDLEIDLADIFDA